MTGLSSHKLAGGALAFGGLLIVVVGVFSPNGPVFGLGFDAGSLARVRNLAEYASLAHTTSILTAIGVMAAPHAPGGLRQYDACDGEHDAEKNL